MSDASNETATIGDVVDATTSDAASRAAAEVADSIPEPSSTTVVVEPDTKDTTATGLDAAAHMRQIAREEADAYMTELLAMEAAKRAEETPDVVVIQAETSVEEPKAPPTPPAEKASAPKADDAPPMAESHPYFRPIKRRKG